MGLGRFTDQNLVPAAPLSGGEWAAGLPLANLKDQTRFVSAPARQLHPNDGAKSILTAYLSRVHAINLVAVLFNTLSLSAEYRITVAGLTGSFEAPVHATDWTPVFGRMFPSTSLAWEEPNYWTGAPLIEDLALYPQHLWIVLPVAVVASAVRLELRDATIDFYDIGGLWISGSWSPRFNFDHGRELSLESRSLSDEAPSGRFFHEERGARRRLTVNWSMLAGDEAMRLFDAGARCGTSRPVLLVPDADDATGLIREAFPATFEKPPAPRRGRPYQSSLSATFKEIIA